MQQFSASFDETRWSIERELKLIELWEREGQFDFIYDPRKPILIIDTPPPYISGKPHVGQVAHYIQIDMISRAYRMLGYNVLVPFYGDRNGLPVEVFVEKTYKVNPHEVAKSIEGREKFLELCRKHLDEVEKEFLKIWRRLGCSFMYWREGTDSEEYRRITQETFIDMWNNGLIYEAERPVIWCPRCRTTLAEAEIEYKEEESNLYYIKFPLMNSEIVIATTRPELIGACLALAYNPSDDRYRDLQGKKAVVPLYNYEVDIVEHKSVDPRFGTGMMMICSYGDQSDVRIIRELGLKPRILIDENGRFNQESGVIAGLGIQEARNRIVEELQKHGYLVKIEKIRRNIPTCWRCGTPVEFIHYREYFLKQLEFKDKLKEIALKMRFLPEEHRKKLLDWIDSIAMDWPISKNRYYATEIPTWKCSKCGSILVPSKGKYYRPWRDPPPWDKCPICGAPRNYLVGETKVFDTWFDSSISILYASGRTKYPYIHELYLRGGAEALRPQGYDIIRTWLYYTLLRIYLLYEKPAFTIVRISGMGLDEKGEAMHKSKGNVIYPEPYIDKYGADAFRFWSAVSAKLGSDYRFSEQLLRTGLLFITKLLNIARFISMFPIIESVETLYPLDKALLSKLNDVIDIVENSYKNTDFYEAAQALYHFTWDIFADHYMEMVKQRAYNFNNAYSVEEQRSSWYTLHTTLRYILLMLAPIMPFITDYIWRKLYSKNTSIHREFMPKRIDGIDRDISKHIDVIIAINSSIWKYKKLQNLRLSDRIHGTLYIPEYLSPYAKDLEVFHRIGSVIIGVPKSGNYIELIKDVYLELG